MADLEDLSQAEVEALLEDAQAPRPTQNGGEVETVRTLEPGDVSRLGEHSSSRLSEVLSAILSREVRVRHHGGEQLESANDGTDSFDGKWFRAEMKPDEDRPLGSLYGVPAGEARILADMMMGRDGSRPPDQLDDVSQKGLLELFQTAQTSTAPVYAGLYEEEPDFPPPVGETVPGARMLEHMEGARLLLQRYTYVVPDVISRGKLVECRLFPEAPSTPSEPTTDLFRSLFDATPDPMFVVNPENNRFVALNRAVCRRLGKKRSRLLEMRIDEVDGLFPGQEVWHRYVEAARNGGPAVFETEPREDSGSTERFEVKLQYEQQPEQDFVVGIARGIASRDAPEAEPGEERISGEIVFPERWMRGFLRRALGQRMREESGFALIGLRYDGLDSLGKQLGDRGVEDILRILAERVSSHLRPWDILTRYEGSGFLVLVRGLNSSEDALGVAERLKSVHHQPVGLGGHELQTEGRIGVVTDTPERTDASDYLRAVKDMMDRFAGGEDPFEVRMDSTESSRASPTRGFAAGSV